MTRWALARVLTCAPAEARPTPSAGATRPTAGAVCGGAPAVPRRYRTVTPPRGSGPRWGRPRCGRGELGEAADAYLHLAGEDPGRAQEAAEGLEEVARAAERADREEGSATGRDRATDRSAGPSARALRASIGAAGGSRARGAGDAASPRARRGAGSGGGGLAAGAARAAPPADRRVRTGDVPVPSRPATVAGQLGARHRPQRRGGLRALARQAVADQRRDEDAALWFAEAARMDSTSADGAAGAVRLRRDAARAG